MTTETLNSSQSDTLIRSNSEEELVRSDYGTKNQSEKEAPASPVMAPSSTRKKRVVSSDEEEEVVRNKSSMADADLDEQNETCSSKKKRRAKRRVSYSDSEESNEDSVDRNKTSNETGGTPQKRPNKTACSSSKKKKHVIKSPDKENSQEEIDRTCTPGFSLEPHSTAKLKVKRRLPLVESTEQSLDSDHHSPADESEVSNGLSSSCSPEKRPSTRNCSTRETASAEKIRRQQALTEYTRKRQRTLSGQLPNLFEDCDSEGAELSKNTLDLTEQDLGREEDDEETESGSDMSDFIVDDSQSAAQEVAAALSALKKPTEDEAYPRYVQLILSCYLNSDFLSSIQDDPDSKIYFNQAKEVIETLLESKKNLVGSTTWVKSGFKEALESCSFLKSQALPNIVKDVTCEACQRKPRHLTECMVFYEDHNGENFTPSKEYSVGRFCAERGSLYHDLHYHDLELEKSCAVKIQKVNKAMGTQSTEDIVQQLINDEEWLHVLYKTFKALLNSADQWAEDGKKRKEMKAYCASFH